MTDFADGTFEVQDRSGSVLAGKYRLEKLLGEGGMASVYRATHRNGSRVAIKILHRVLSVDKDIRDRFLYEGYASNASGHKGAVHVIDDAVAEDGSVFLVMEYLDGVSVNDLWERNHLRLSPRVSLSIVHSLLDILVTAHGNRVIHRDLKPENIFITREGELKLLDFGIARLPQSMRASTPTQTGARLGTPAFMPPEQARGNVRDIDVRSDIYGAGAVLFTLMTGQYVYDCTNPSEYLIKAATEPARSLASLLPDIPASVAHVVDKALSFDKAARWESAAVMLEAVRWACEENYGGFISRAEFAELVRPSTEVLQPLAGGWLPEEEPRSPAVQASRLHAKRDFEMHVAPTLAASTPNGLSKTNSDVASVRTTSFAKTAGPGRHLWLFGVAVLVALAFSGALFFGARSTGEANTIAPARDGSEPPIETVAAPVPSDPPAAAASSARADLPPPASAAPHPVTKTGKPPRPAAPPIPPPSPASAQPAPKDYDPYLYQ